MAITSLRNVDQQVSDLVSTVNAEEWSRQYWEQGEFLALQRLMSPSLIADFMLEVESTRPKINRNFIPKHKKGGSISYYSLQEAAPAILAFYQHQAWIDVLSNIAGVPLLLCP